MVLYEVYVLCVLYSGKTVNKLRILFLSFMMKANKNSTFSRKHSFFFSFLVLLVLSS